MATVRPSSTSHSLKSPNSISGSSVFGYSALIGVLSFTFLYWIALSRFVAADEGYFLLAARLVSEGKIPYTDFFFPQMPFSPYLLSSWGSVFGESWSSYRALVALCASSIVSVCFGVVTRRAGLGWGLLTAILLLSNGLFLGWFSVVKSYPLSGVFLAISFALLMSTERRDASAWKFISAGLCIGLATNVRLFYAALIPVCLLLFLFRRQWRGLLLFIGGGLLTLLPHLYFIFSDFDAYWFGNLGYHLDRTHRAAEVDLQSKIKIAKALLGIEQLDRVDGVQFPLLFYITIFGGLVLALLRKPSYLFLTAWVTVLFVLYLIPRPTHLQYYSTLVPYLAVGTALILSQVAAKQRKRAIGVAAVCLTLHLFSFPSAVHRFTQTGVGVKGIQESNRESSRLDSVRAVSAALREYFPSQAVVLSQWPGFLVETDLTPFSGSENQFWTRIGHKISAEERTKYHLVSPKEFKNSVQLPEVQGVVIERTKISRYFRGNALEKAGFVKKDEVNGVLIFVREDL